MKFEDILNEIEKNTGIERIKTELYNPEKASEIFKKIAESRLKWSSRKLDIELTRSFIQKLISWAYLLEDNKLDPVKGLLIKGATGRGKTFLTETFAEFLKIDNLGYKSNGKIYPLTFKCANAKQMALDFQEKGYQSIHKYCTMPSLLIDDIGSELDLSSYFGNKINVLDIILYQREANNLMTFGTTNMEQLSDKYDDRIISRMSSLFNIVVFQHDKDFRKIKKQ